MFTTRPGPASCRPFALREIPCGLASRALLALGALGPMAGCGTPPARIGLGFGGNTTIAMLDTLLADAGSPVRARMAYDSVTRLDLRDEIARASRFIADRGVVAVIGPQDSRSALLVASVYDEASMPVLLPNANHPALDSASSFIFRMTPTIPEEARFLARFLVDYLRVGSAVIFYVDDEYGHVFRDGLRGPLSDGGVSVLAEVPYTRALCDGYRAAPGIDAVIRSGLVNGVPEAVILAGRQYESSCVLRAVHARHPGVRFVGGDALLTEPEFLRAVGSAVDSLYVVSFWDAGADERSQAFADRFRRITGRAPAPHEALLWDAVQLLGAAVRETGTSRTGVADLLNSLGRTRPAYRGVTGSIAFGDLASTRMVVLRGAPQYGTRVPWP